MKTLPIVFHSCTGGTRQMAEAACRGAISEVGMHTRLLHAPNAGPEDILAADDYIFATPENLAAIAGIMKDFFDRTYYPALGRINGRPYATLVCAGSDGHNAARQITRIATGWRLRSIAEPLIVCANARGDPGTQDHRGTTIWLAPRKLGQRLRQVWQWGSSEAATNFQALSRGLPASGRQERSDDKTCARVDDRPLWESWASVRFLRRHSAKPARNTLSAERRQPF